MSENFYEVLGIQADASPEDIRRAYKKKALQTHPDRLPPGATTDDKQGAEERFRRVNNAYEVLMDEKNRKLYDLYGVWPPPEDFPDEPRRDRNHRSGNRRPHHSPPGWGFSDNSPMFDSAFTPGPRDPFARRHRSQPTPMFRDPFELFNAIFADMHNDLSFGPSPWFPRPSDSYFGRPGPMLRESRPSLFPPMPIFHPYFDAPVIPDERFGGSSGQNAHRETFSGSSRNLYGSRSNSNSPRWVSESKMVRTVNGVTQSVWKRKDSDGNEHVTYTYPDGRERHLINGVEQPHSAQHIQDARAEPQYVPPPPVIPPEQVEGSHKRRWWNRNR